MQHVHQYYIKKSKLHTSAGVGIPTVGHKLNDDIVNFIHNCYKATKMFWVLEE